MSSSLARENSFNDKTSKSNSERGDSEHHKTQIANNAMGFLESKWIQVFINGDEYFSGCRCVVNSRYYRNLDMFLNYLTERLKPSFGAVRNIYTPVNGHPVRKLEDLISKHKYVAAGNERFKKLDSGYTESTDKKYKRCGWKPKAHSKLKISKAKSLCHNALTLYFHRNGNFRVKPNKIDFYPQDLENLELSVQKICESIKCGPIKRICTLNGTPIHSVEELINNQTYVIVGKHEIFNPGQYGSLIVDSTSKGKHHSLHSSRKPSSGATGRSSGIYSQISARSSKLRSSLSANKNNQEVQHEVPVYNSFNITELGNGVDSLDSFKQTESKLSSNETIKIKINLDDDLSGIFRSKTQNHLTAGAVEVEDSSETIVDIPVDLLNAEEVEDEITPDMERSLQHLSLDVPEEIVAYLPTMQNDKTMQNSEERQVAGNKYNLNHSQTLDIHNIFA